MCECVCVMCVYACVHTRVCVGKYGCVHAYVCTCMGVRRTINTIHTHALNTSRSVEVMGGMKKAINITKRTRQQSAVDRKTNNHMFS